MSNDNERNMLRAAERVAFYEDAKRLVEKRLVRARAEYVGLGGGQDMPLEVRRALVWLSPLGEHTKSAFITAGDLAEISEATGWYAYRIYVMETLGFKAASVYICGIKTRVWVRGEVAKPRDIHELTRYYPKSEDGKLRLSIRRGMEAV